MPFVPPPYNDPAFDRPLLADAPLVRFEPAPRDGVAPENYHATTIYPEYVQIRKGEWRLAPESRMDCVMVLDVDNTLRVKEFRNLRAGEQVVVGRGENGEDGIYVHSTPFTFEAHVKEAFAFRTQISRETSFSYDYDELYSLLEYERENGFVLWVLGPAVTFDKDARDAFARIIERGYVHALLAGNALATHDIEGALFGTALGQELYTKRNTPRGHYKHLDSLNHIRRIGSIEAAVRDGTIPDGIMRALVLEEVPFVLAGSIRDDGPMPEVVADVYRAQDLMRRHASLATTVVAIATQLHSIATGNMTPSFRVMPSGLIRPVYFYNVDMSEFATNKLANRGSLTARSILTNAQDFIVNLDRGLRTQA